MYTATCRGTPCSYERRTVEPVCHMVRGVVAGLLEACVDKKVERQRSASKLEARPSKQPGAH